MKKIILSLVTVLLVVFGQAAFAAEVMTIKQKSVPVTVDKETITVAEPHSKDVTSLDTYYFMANDVPYVCFKEEKKEISGLRPYSLKLGTATETTPVYCTVDASQFKIEAPLDATVTPAPAQ